MATFTQKLKNLFIPEKVMNSTDARAIERWVSGDLSSFLNALVAFINAGGGTTFYASLTGPGETSPSGALVQGGDFQIDGNTVLQTNFTGPGSGATATFNWTVDSGPITLSTATAGVKSGAILMTGSGITVTSENVNTGFLVQVDGGNQAFFAKSSVGGVTELGFYTKPPIAQQSSTGITTVAQLVTVLQNYGLLS